MDEVQFPKEPGDYKMPIFRELMVSDSHGNKCRKVDNQAARLSNALHCYSTTHNSIMSCKNG